jgi:deoxyribose-phosphate aldolase
MSAIEFAKFFDHTALKPDATESAIKTLCKEARTLGVAAVCVNPIWIPLCVTILEGSDVLPITVVGFPLGSSTGESKVFEARQAISQGAKEIDMVLSVGAWKSGFKEDVRKDIRMVQKACGDIPLKVIFETSLLMETDIDELARMCAEEQVAFIKTSTGFGSRGASVADIEIMAKAIAAVKGSQTAIKASGGIKTLKDALSMIDAGATRIGSSATVALVDEFRSLS